MLTRSLPLAPLFGTALRSGAALPRVWASPLSTDAHAPMPSRPLGNTGVRISAIGLGTMPLSIQGRPSEETATEVIHESIRLGVTLIDTADVYGLDNNDLGHSERLIAKALKSYPGRTDHIIVATKAGMHRPNGGWEIKGKPEDLRRACENSIKNLGVRCIDLFQLHCWDKSVKYSEQVEAVAQMQREGMIRWVGLSNVTKNMIEEAQKIVEVVSVQNGSSVKRLDPALRFVAENKITLLAYSPMGGHKMHKSLMSGSSVLKELAAKYNCSSYDIALAGLLAIESEYLVPIPGASKVSSIRSSAKAATLKLEQPDLDRIRNLAIKWE